MKKTRFRSLQILLFAAIFLTTALPASAAVDIDRYIQYQAPITVQPIAELEGRRDDFLCGADVSSLWAIVECGGEYFDMDGQKLIEGDEISNALAIMKKHGLNAIRLRLWNNPDTAPTNHGPGGLNDLDVDLIIAKKAHALGIKVMLDFHYSDTWADPGRQIKPTAWTNIQTIEELCDAMYTFTYDTLAAFAKEGCMPELVQIGNETNSGFMYHEMTSASAWATVSGGRPSGSASNEANHIALVKAGVKAVRDADPNNEDPETRTQVIYHLADGHNINLYRNRAAMLARNNVDYDIMGASYYPYWHGTITQITATLTAMTEEYGKDVLIAETGWGFCIDSTNPHGTGSPRLSNTFNQSLANTHPEFAVSPQGQADQLRAATEVVAKLKDNKGLGVFLWEPAWIPTPRMGSGWAAGNTNIVMANQGYFDYAGRGLPSLTAWARFFPIQPVSVTESIVAGYDANVKVVLDCADMTDQTVTVSLFDKLAAVDAGGVAILRLTKEDIPAATEEQRYPVKVFVNGDEVQADLSVRVIPKNNEIWTVAVGVGEGKTQFGFFADIETNGNFEIFVNDVLKSCTKMEGANILEIGEAVKQGDTVLIKGVKYPELFPSYSFTFRISNYQPT